MSRAVAFAVPAEPFGPFPGIGALRRALQRREPIDLSDEDCAARFGVSAALLSRIAAAAVAPDDDTAARIWAGLHVPPTVPTPAESAASSPRRARGPGSAIPPVGSRQSSTLAGSPADPGPVGAAMAKHDRDGWAINLYFGGGDVHRISMAEARSLARDLAALLALYDDPRLFEGEAGGFACAETDLGGLARLDACGLVAS